MFKKISMPVILGIMAVGLAVCSFGRVSSNVPPDNSKPIASTSFLGTTKREIFRAEYGHDSSNLEVSVSEDGKILSVTLDAPVVAENSSDHTTFIYALGLDTPRREFLIFFSQDRSKDFALARPVGGKVDTVNVDGERIFIPIPGDADIPFELDGLFDETKNLLNAEVLIVEYINTYKPVGWPADPYSPDIGV